MCQLNNPAYATLYCASCNLTWQSSGDDINVACREYQRAGLNGLCKAEVIKYIGETHMRTDKYTLTDGMIARELIMIAYHRRLLFDDKYPNDHMSIKLPAAVDVRGLPIVAVYEGRIFIHMVWEVGDLLLSLDDFATKHLAPFIGAIHNATHKADPVADWD